MGEGVKVSKSKVKVHEIYISVQALEETERQLEGLKSRLLKEEKEYGVELKCRGFTGLRLSEFAQISEFFSFR